jgi:uncharacterized alkaline shock family protein YloU
MTEETTHWGQIQISPQAITAIAFQATVESYGVVGLAPKSFLDGLTNVLVKDPTHGIEVAIDTNQIDIDIFIIVEYGTRIKSVAANVANTVRFQVEKIVGLPIHEINVHVQGLRFSHEA